MNNSVLLTKFFIPKNRDEYIQRVRVVNQISRGLDSNLVVLKAPAGFGKTTALAQWVRTISDNKVWITLDRTENDPIDFLLCFLGSVKPYLPTIDKSFLEMPQNAPLDSLESYLTLFINQIVNYQKKLIFVLDDFHKIENETIIDALCFLVGNKPKNIKVVIATRADLPFSCAKYRATGELVEITEDDLRFTQNETKLFINKFPNIRISDKDILELFKKTEGWAAGLKLSLLSLMKEKENPNYISQLSGANQHLKDFLLDEVLLLQTPRIQEFLLQTSILNRLTAPLTDYMLGINNSQELLDYINRNGLFLSSLDNDKQWYRYHQMFSDLLIKRLNTKYPERVADLYSRSAKWQLDNGFISEAISHIIKSGDYDYATKIIDKYAGETWAAGKISTLLYWLKLIPDNVLQSDPELCLLKAWIYYLGGKNGLMNQYINISTDFQKCILDHKRLVRLEGLHNVIIAAYNSNIGNLEETKIAFGKVEHYLSPSDIYWRIATYVSLGIAYTHTNQLQEASNIFHKVLKISENIDFHLAFITSSSYLAKVRMLQGNLLEAQQICNNAFLFLQNSLKVIPNLLSLYIDHRYSEIALFQYKLPEAEKKLKKQLESCDIEDNTLQKLRGLIIAIQLKIIQNEDDIAYELIENANRLLITTKTIDLSKSIKALEAWLALRNAQTYVGLDWVNSIKDDLSKNINCSRELEHQIFLEVLIETEQFEAAGAHIEQLLQETRKYGFSTLHIIALIMKTRILMRSNKSRLAIATLEEAIHIGKMHNLLGPFIYLGETLNSLYQNIPASDILSRRFIKKIISAQNLRINAGTRIQEVILTDRETQVVNELTSGLTYLEIALKLNISVNTVRTHIKNIYAKLGVYNRVEAVRKAHQLDLVEI